MGYDYKLNTTHLQQEAWQAALGNLLRGSTPWKPWQGILPMLNRRLLANGQFDATQNSYWIAVDGSIRGVLLEPRDGEITLTLAGSASLTDWALAGWLLAQAVAAGAEAFDEDGQALAFSDLEPASFAQRSQQYHQQSWKMVKAIAKKDQSAISFPIGWFQVSLSLDDLNTKPIEQLEREMVGQCSRFGNAYVASRLLRQSSEAAEKITFASYALIPTLLPQDVSGIIVASEAGVLTEEPVAMTRFRELMGERCIEAGSYLYVEGLDPSADSELFTSLTGLTVNQFRFMNYKQLANLPVAVWLSVAGADGTSDEKEAQAFFKYLESATANPQMNPHFCLLSKILIGGHFRTFMAELKEGQLSITDHFNISLQVMSTMLNLSEAHSLKQALYDMAEAIAKASGGGFLGFGSKVSSEERQVLEVLKSRFAF